MDIEIDQSEQTFEPRIVGFICNWGAYTGLEMAGINRISYSTNVRFIKLMCLGRIHLGLVLKAFERGADGVILVGCPTQGCKYEFGIEKAKESIDPTQKIMDLLGIGSERLSLIHVPVGGGEYLAEQTNKFVESIRSIGPGLSGNEGLSDSESAGLLLEEIA